MRTASTKLLILSSLILLLGSYSSKLTADTGLVIDFQEDTNEFSKKQKQLIKRILVNSEKEIRRLLPDLPKDIRVIVVMIDRNIDVVGGVTGRTDTRDPAQVLIEISKVFPGGIKAAAKAALRPTIFHEFHHLSRGWAIQDNKYGPGISTAAVNEGLAVVFSEKYTGVKFEANEYPKEANSWVEEILALPEDANYQKWMFQHPDGRSAIGYRAGHFIIRQAMAHSGKDILELSQYEPREILKLAGY